MNTNAWLAMMESVDWMIQPLVTIQSNRIRFSLLWTATSNAYGDMYKLIFTPCLVFQCVFDDFQCEIMPLRAFSIALKFTTIYFILFFFLHT